MRVMPVGKQSARGAMVRSTLSVVEDTARCQHPRTARAGWLDGSAELEIDSAAEADRSSRGTFQSISGDHPNRYRWHLARKSGSIFPFSLAQDCNRHTGLICFVIKF